MRRGFEGGQMPLQRRLPKFGFSSRKSLVREDVRVVALEGLADVAVTLPSLRAAGVVGKNVKYVKLFGEGRLSRAYTVCGISATKGARAAVEASGGRIED